jgi:preprotein translocase subunit SecY
MHNLFSVGKLVLIVVLCLLIVAAVVFMQDGVRKIPVQHARRTGSSSGSTYGSGVRTFIPLRVNMAGVIPVIFASSIMMFPVMISQWFYTRFPDNVFLEYMVSFLGYGHWVHMLLYAVLVIFFTYFYTAIQLNPTEMADNLKKYGGFIPGIRAGRKTAEFIDRIVTRVTFCGALFLAAISLIPSIMSKFLAITFYFGGTSLLIVVGVLLDTVRQIESHMVTRHYDGFLKS